MSNEQDVQEKRLNAMKYKILKTEQENLKTREKTTDQMVETIRRIIMDEAKKNEIIAKSSAILNNFVPIPQKEGEK